MRTQASHSDSIISEATRYNTIFATLPLPLVTDAAVGAFSPPPTSPVVDASGLISATVLAYRLFVATPKSTADPISGPDASAETDAPLDGITTRVRGDAGRSRRRRSV